MARSKKTEVGETVEEEPVVLVQRKLEFSRV